MSTNPLIRKRRTVEIELLPGNTEAELDRLQDEWAKAAAAEKADGKRMGTRSKARQLAKQIDELAEQTRGDALIVTLADVGPTKFRQTQDACPPRKGNETDKAYGYDPDAFDRALVFASLVEPKVSRQEFDEWVDGRAPNPDDPEDEGVDPVGTFNWAKVVEAVHKLHGTEVDLPKSSAVSWLDLMRESDFGQLESGE